MLNMIIVTTNDGIIEISADTHTTKAEIVGLLICDYIWTNYTVVEMYTGHYRC